MALTEGEAKEIVRAFQQLYEALKVHEKVILDMREFVVKQEKRIKDLENAYIDDKLIGRLEDGPNKEEK